jgi:thiol:disulfide interchange protein DsbD
MDNKNRKTSADTYVLTFDGIIEKDWHVFAVYSDGGPLPLEVIFKTKREF